MVADEGGALPGPVLGRLEGALPLQHRPALVPVLGELGEDGAEVDLAVAERAEAAGAVLPGLVAGIDALAAGGPELGVLHVEHPDPLVVEVDVLQVVQLLQDEVAGVVEQAGPGVVIHPVPEHLHRRPVEQVLAGMHLVAEVHARFLVGVEDGPPAPGQLVEGLLHQAGGALGIGIEVGPGQGAREGDAGGQAHPAGGLRPHQDLVHRPGLPRLGIAPHGGGDPAVEHLVIGRVHGHQLALHVGGKLGDLEAEVGQDALDLVAVGVALGGQLQVEEAAVPGGNLHAPVAHVRHPAADGGQAVEGRFVPRELGKENRRSLHGLSLVLMSLAASLARPAQRARGAFRDRAAGPGRVRRRRPPGAGEGR